MMIFDRSEDQRPHATGVQSGDDLNADMINALPHPLMVESYGSPMRVMLETVCVQTGAVRKDVCGQIDRGHWSDIRVLIDADLNEHDPDDFWIED